MKKFWLLSTLAAVTLSFGGLSASASPSYSVGVVNFASCMSESKIGKREHASFDSVKTQMASLIEDAEKQIANLSSNLSNPEYMDSLSPEAEAELKEKYRSLNNEINQYQNQYYQVLNQAQMRVIQTIGASVQQASERIAKQQKLSVIMNKDACFFHLSALDITPLVIAEMDKTLDQQEAKLADAS